MSRHTLVDFFEDLAATAGTFLAFDDGYRTVTHRYAEVGAAARAFAATLAARGIGQHDRIVIWSENRPEWIVALWGALVAGVVVVPVDARIGLEFVRKVCGLTGAKLVMAGNVVWPDQGPARATALPDGTPVLRLAAIDWHAAGTPAPVAVAPSDTAEIIFTSGATAEPRGVVISHRNILANIVPIEREIRKYRPYGRPFFPLRFLDLLPLSHLFGQALATFIPPMLPGTVIFTSSYAPGDIVRQIRRRRVSVLVSVPKILEVLRDHVVGVAPSAAEPLPRPMHWLRRWWRYRDVHRLLGWKFWCFVVGAAPLDPAIEEFWSRLGFVVIQGYGLTETAPIVTINHPFAARRGSVGKPIEGVEMRLGTDGEILVRGDNVTSGYFNAPDATSGAIEDGWLHTGDIGRIDDDGLVFVRGRKKEMIVTPEGLNVFPDDVERVLNDIPGVRESGVVGVATGAEERVHAVLVLEPGVDVDDVVRQANARLADHQRIRGATRWPGVELPRTEGTRKLKRVALGEWAAGSKVQNTAAPSSGIEALVSRIAGGRAVLPGTTIEELGLSSLERVELMAAIEQQFQTTLDEGAFARADCVEGLKALVESASRGAAAGGAIAFPSWNQAWFVRAVRRVVLGAFVLPVTRAIAWLSVAGRQHVDGLEGPVIFAANHQSHLDTPVILAALPGHWRYRVAPAMAKEFFKAHFFPSGASRGEHLRSSALYYLASFFFNAFPLPQRESGTRDALRYIGELADRRCSILIFPEGVRSDAGEIAVFRPGVGMMASRLGLPVVPVRLEGLEKVLHRSWRMVRPGRARVVFGAPMRLEGQDFEALARRIEEAVRGL